MAVQQSLQQCATTVPVRMLTADQTMGQTGSAAQAIEIAK
jgi:hypothetical protein